jgi:23S rRNA (uracil-5-)-methyltransferase RumA
MKKGDIIQGTIEYVNFPNKGVMHTDQGSCIIKNTVPGQKVEARVTKKRSGKAEANLLQVLEKSPLETEPPCPHFGICGGCTYLNLPYEEELKLKEGQVRRLLIQALEEAGRLRSENTEAGPGEEKDPLSWFEGILPSPREFGYRNKMEFSFGDEYKGGPLALGMHRRGSFYDIVSVTDCQIVDGDYRQILKLTRDYFDQKKVPFYHRMQKTGYLRHLLVRKASITGEILIDLVTTSQESHDLAEYAGALLELPLEGKIAGILHTTNDSVADVVQDEGTEILYGRSWFSEKLLGLSFRITPFSFFQTNSWSAEVLYDTARKYILETGLKEGATVFDLYCGTGTITQLMAPAARKVIGVEIVEEAVEAARTCAAKNGLSNCEFIAGDVLKVIDEITEKPDFIILDPPRDGIHPKALPKILRYGVDYILYISCKPTSLARDLPAFIAEGYWPVRGICVDQFPWTANVETILLMSKKNTEEA